jgi:phosphoglycolate phosphatase-like HAD superfamily hydrolase
MSAAINLSPNEQRILARAGEKIGRIRANLIHSKGLTDEEARMAANAGLIATDQRWWWTEEWQKKEREAEKEARTRGGLSPFAGADELLKDLHRRARCHRKKA